MGKAEGPFWQFDEAIGEGRFYHEQKAIRLKAHHSQERFNAVDAKHEIFQLGAKTGTCTYILARPYILEPNYMITMGLYSQPTEQGDIGEVMDSQWNGMRHREVGQVQAWFYPEERTLVLWECFLEDSYRAEDPRTDKTLYALWSGFEQFLLKTLPQVERIATPSYEPLFKDDKKSWPDFLASLGYSPIGARAFGKNVKSSI